MADHPQPMTGHICQSLAPMSALEGNIWIAPAVLKVYTIICLERF